EAVEQVAHAAGAVALEAVRVDHQQALERARAKQAHALLLLQIAVEVLNLLVDDFGFRVSVFEEVENENVVFADAVEDFGPAEDVDEVILDLLAEVIAELVVRQL